MTRGEETLKDLLTDLHPKDSDTYQLMRDILIGGVHDKDYGFYMYQWIDYTECGQWRLKMLHDLKMKDGRILENMYPNANAWTNLGGNKEIRVNDNDVAFIRVCKNQIGDKLQ